MATALVRVPAAPAPTGLRTVAVAFPGDSRAATTWSGTPAGLTAGLEAEGLEVHTISTLAHGALEELAVDLVAPAHLVRSRGDLRACRRAARTGRLVGGLRTRALARILPEVDAVVQIGTGYQVPDGVPFVTFEDMTIVQAAETENPQWRALSRRGLRARIDRQRRAYERARGCCLTTPWAAESVVRDYGIDPAKVHVVGIGRNRTPEPPAERDWSVPRFLFVGRHWEPKNGPLVLRAFGELRRRIPEARLDLVGAHPRLDEPGVTGHGLLELGDPAHRGELERLYAEATCFVLPSRYEAVGIVFAEAAAAGIASIGTTAGGGAGVIGEAGTVVDPDDEAGLVAAMLELADPATAERLGAAALARAPLFTWTAVARRVLAALAFD